MTEKKQDYYEVNRLSNSRLNLIDPELGGSPLKFAEGFDDEAYKYSLEMGTALHKMILEPDLFIAADFERPTDNVIKWADAVSKLGGVTDKNILKGRELADVMSNLKNEQTIIRKFEEGNGPDWVQFLHESEDKIVLKAEDHMRLIKATQAVANHPRSAEILTGEKEIEVYFTLHGMKCKSKIDNLLIDVDKNLVRVVDVKSTSKNPRGIQKFVEYWRTYRQLAFYGYAALNEAAKRGLKDPTFEYYVVQAGLAPPNECIIGRIDEEWIKQGQNELYGLIQRVKYADKIGWDHSMEEYDSNFILSLDKPEE